MTEPERDVKVRPADKVWEKCLGFIDAHPRVGWYVATLTTINFLMELLQIVQH